MDSLRDYQEIYLESNPDGDSYPINSADVQVRSCRVYERSRDSSKVKSRAIIDYRWETKVYDGRLVALHKDNNYLAYVLHTRSTCSVRVINRSSKARILIKNFVGQVVDVAWAFTSWPLFLAISDEGGNVVVYTISESLTGTEIIEKKYLRIENSNSATPRQPPHRISWCPYVPDNVNTAEESSGTDDEQVSDGNDDHGRLMAISYGGRVDVVNVERIVKEFGSDVTYSSIQSAIATLEVGSDISAAAIAPDASALAVSTLGGEIMFHVLEATTIKYAQTLKPHKGRPVTSMIFLDNFAGLPTEDTLWKYLLTASDENRELKLWNCENWDCVATLRIDPPEGQSEHKPLTLAADWTSSYVFLTDIERKSLYIVEMVLADGRIQFTSFNEFPLLNPALSLAVLSAGPKRFRPTSPGATSELDESNDNDFSNTVGVQAFLFAVNPKSLLELDIRFVPPRRDDAPDDSLLSTVSSCKLEAIHDEVSDLSLDLLRTTPSASDIVREGGADYASFSLGRRGSTPTHSASPSERTPTRELEVDQRVSASPSSQEVSKILGTHPLVTSSSADEDVSCLLDTNNVEDDEERPVSPITQTLLNLTTPAAVTVSNWNETNNSLLPSISTMPMANSGDLTALTATLANMTNELTLAAAKIDRQEEQLQQMKHLVSSQQSMWEAVLHLLHDRERQDQTRMQDIYEQMGSFKPEQIGPMLAHVVEDSVRTGLDNVVRTELRTTVVACANDAFKIMKDSVQGDVAQKLTATDTVVRDTIGKMLKSKQIVDTIGQAAGQVAASVAMTEANAAYREAFQKVIAPSFESTARGLFTQMNDAFQCGTKEYLDQLQRQSAIVQHNTEEWKKALTSQLLTFADQLKTTSESQLAVMHTNMEKHFDLLTQRLQETLYANVRSVVKEEVVRAMADGQQALNDTVMRVLRSQAPTPVPMMGQNDRDRAQTLSEVNHYISTCQFNQAFQTALQARDTSLVTHACQRIDPGRLFENAGHLQLPILLSLLHQLAVDLNNNPELKLSYMQEAVPSIDSKMLNDVGMNTIRQVQEKVSTFLQANTATPHARRAKSVLMLLNSLKSP